MKDNLFSFYFAIVSKSLLIVLGTWPKPRHLNPVSWINFSPPWIIYLPCSASRFSVRSCNSTLVGFFSFRCDRWSPLAQARKKPPQMDVPEGLGSLLFQMMVCQQGQLPNYCSQTSSLAIPYRNFGRRGKNCTGGRATAGEFSTSPRYCHLCNLCPLSRTGRPAVRADACAPSGRLRCAATQPVLECAPYVGA